MYKNNSGSCANLNRFAFKSHTAFVLIAKNSQNTFLNLSPKISTVDCSVSQGKKGFH
jgi:hypothetical protein|tara:strand:- start:7673 stop:7843 length:171 start_codon:yes stop_codon:yes gene_type:complete